jgi:hypothetical protein
LAGAAGSAARADRAALHYRRNEEDVSVDETVNPIILVSKLVSGLEGG